MNAIEKKIAEQIGALLIDNAKLATQVEMQNGELARLRAELAKSAEPTLPLQNGNGSAAYRSAKEASTVAEKTSTPLGSEPE